MENFGSVEWRTTEPFRLKYLLKPYLLKKNYLLKIKNLDIHNYLSSLKYA